MYNGQSKTVKEHFCCKHLRDKRIKVPFFYTQLQEIYPEENWLQNRLCYFELGYRSETTMGPIAISESQKHQWCLRGVYI